MENTSTKKESKAKGGKVFRGVVVSDKMKKTIVVEVTRFVKHQKYQKYFKVSKRFKAHDEENKHKVGEKVEIREVKPISKDKSFIII